MVIVIIIILQQKFLTNLYIGEKIYNRIDENKGLSDSKDVKWKFIPNAESIYNNLIFKEIFSKYGNLLKR